MISLSLQSLCLSPKPPNQLMTPEKRIYLSDQITNFAYHYFIAYMKCFLYML